jgi:hypothetical protein
MYGVKIFSYWMPGSGYQMPGGQERGGDWETWRQGDRERGRLGDRGTGRLRNGFKNLTLDLNLICNYNVIRYSEEVVSNESKSCKNW